MNIDDDTEKNETWTPDMGLGFLRNRGASAPGAQAPTEQSPAWYKTIADALGVNRDYGQFANGMRMGAEQNGPVSPLGSLLAGLKNNPNFVGFADGDDAETERIAPLDTLNPLYGDSAKRAERRMQEETQALLTNGRTRRWKKALDDALNGWNGNGDREAFAERLWDKTIDAANDELEKIASKLGVRADFFGKERDGLLWGAMNDINQRCHYVVDGRQGRMYGCANMQRVSLSHPGAPLPMPMNTTFLAYGWGNEHLAAAMRHESGHLAIYRVSQMIEDDIYARLHETGIPPVSEEVIAMLKTEFKKLDLSLDQQDLAAFDPATGEIGIDQKADVWDKLGELVEKYLRLRRRNAARGRK